MGAAAIHFAVIFEHFDENVLYGVFFLVIGWAQVIWAALVLWRPALADRPDRGPDHRRRAADQEHG